MAVKGEEGHQGLGGFCFSPFFSKKIDKQNKGGATLLASSFTLKCILRQKKNHENSNTSPCKNIIFKKSSKTNQNPSRYYNSITNLKFQHKPKYHRSKTLI